MPANAGDLVVFPDGIGMNLINGGSDNLVIYIADNDMALGLSSIGYRTSRLGRPDEFAQLALDRERGLRARVGYLTNQPRTYGVMMRFDY